MSNIEKTSNPYDVNRIQYEYTNDINDIKKKLKDENSNKLRFNIISPREKLIRPLDLKRKELGIIKDTDTIKIENKPLEDVSEKERIKIKLKNYDLKPNLSDIFDDNENKK
jgi:hypothetical protein